MLLSFIFFFPLNMEIAEVSLSHGLIVVLKGVNIRLLSLNLDNKCDE